MKYKILEHLNRRLPDEGKSSSIRDKYQKIRGRRRVALEKAKLCDTYLKTGLFPYDITNDENEYSRYESGYRYSLGDGGSGIVRANGGNDAIIDMNAYDPTGVIGVDGLVSSIVSTTYPAIPWFKHDMTREGKEKATDACYLEALQSTANKIGIDINTVGAVLQGDPQLNEQMEQELGITSEQARSTYQKMVEQLLNQKKEAYQKQTIKTFDFFNETTPDTLKNKIVTHSNISGAFVLYSPIDITKTSDIIDHQVIYPLNKVVIEDSPSGKIHTVIVWDKYHLDSLSDEFYEKLVKTSKRCGKHIENEVVTIYTMIRFDDKKYYYEMEWEEESIKDTYKEGPIDECPFVIHRPITVAEDSYGFSFCSIFLPLLETLSDASEKQRYLMHLMSFAAILMRGVDIAEHGVENIFDINGQLLPVSDIEAMNAKVLSFDVGPALSSMAPIMQHFNGIIQEAFLMPGQYQRNQDRVTATEVSNVINQQDLRRSMRHSSLNEFNLALLRLRVAQMKKLKLWDIPSDQEKDYGLFNQVGIHAVGEYSKANEMMQTLMFFNSILNSLNPILAFNSQVSKMFEDVLYSMGVNATEYLDADGLMNQYRSDIENRAREQQQLLAQQQAMMLQQQSQENSQ